MKFTCPHCNGRGVSLFSKLISAPHQAATCSLCGGLSSEPSFPTFASVYLYPLAPFVVGIWAISVSSWLPVFLGVVATIALEGYFLYSRPLIPLTPGAVAKAKRTYLTFALGITAVFIGAALCYAISGA